MLVGGRGTRLRPLTIHTPKPMLPVAGVPFLTHMLARAREAGVTRVVLATSYRADVFEGYFGAGERVGLELVYLTEEVPLGTGGAIRNAAAGLSPDRTDPVLIFNGDVLAGVDLRALVARHEETAADVTLHLRAVEDPRAFGVVPTDAAGRVLAFLEKTDSPPTNAINAGCYVFSRDILEAIPTGRPVSVERETFPGLLASGALVQSYVDATYWLDLGTPAAFVQGSRDLVTGVAPSPALPGPTGPALVLPGARVAPDAVLTGGAVVGAGAVVQQRAVLDGAVIFDGATVCAEAVVDCSVVGTRAMVGARTLVSASVVGDGAQVGADNEITCGSRVWAGARLGDKSLRVSSDES